MVTYTSVVRYGRMEFHTFPNKIFARRFILVNLT